MTTVQNLVVIGIDGVSYRRLLQYSEDGKLPTFAKIIAEGASGPLESTIIPTSPIAWSASFSGKNPAKTGMYGFFTKSKDSYSWSAVSALNRMSRDVWEVASDSGRRSIVVGFPFTHPVRPFNGVLVGGSFTPDFSRCVYPPEMTDYIIGELGYTICPPRVTAEEICHSIAKRFSIGRRLLKEQSWDLFMLGFEQIEMVHHFIMLQNPDEMEECYRLFDAELGRFLDTLPKEACVLIYSDHGNVYYPKAFHLSDWLIQKGYLKLRPGVELRRLKKEQFRYELSSIREKNPQAMRFLAMAGLYLMGRIAKRYFRFLKGILPSLSLPARATPRHFGRRDGLSTSPFYDFARSRAYPDITAAANYGGLYVNLEGRDAQGTVRAGPEYESLREELRKELLAIRDPATGQQVVTSVWKKEELFNGPYLDEIYDLVLETAEEYHVLLTDQWLYGKAIKPYHHSSHERDGVLLAWGPVISHEPALRTSILNIAPTILQLLGCPIPNDYDGTVVEELLSTEFLERFPIQYAPSSDETSMLETPEYSPDELQAIEKRLMELGYLE